MYAIILTVFFTVSVGSGTSNVHKTVTSFGHYTTLQMCQEMAKKMTIVEEYTLPFGKVVTNTRQSAQCVYIGPNMKE